MQSYCFASAEEGLTHSHAEEWEYHFSSANFPWDGEVAGGTEPSGEEFRTPKHRKNARKAYSLSTSSSQVNWLLQCYNFDQTSGGDPMPTTHSQGLLHHSSPITGAKFFRWQERVEEQSDEDSALNSSEVLLHEAASAQANGATPTEPALNLKTRRKRGRKQRRQGNPGTDARTCALRQKAAQIVSAIARGDPDTERLVLEAYDLTDAQEGVIRPIVERMLLSLTDPEYPLDMAALGATLDAADHGDCPQERTITIGSANVSSWRREILDWVVYPRNAPHCRRGIPPTATVGCKGVRSLRRGRQCAQPPPERRPRHPDCDQSAWSVPRGLQHRWLWIYGCKNPGV